MAEFASMKRIVQISDTHLSPTKRHFDANWEPLAAWLTSISPHLIIHTGDVTVDGAGMEEDMRFCAARLAQLPVAVLTVPGNHDVGEPAHPYQPVNRERLDRWRRYFGPDWWSRDLESWRLIGLDSMLFGSGLPEEAEQIDWLHKQAGEAEGRRLAVFTHQPLMLEHADEPDTGYWSVKPGPRAALLRIFDRYDVALVSTGHLHRSHDSVISGRRYIWGGAAAFAVGPSLAPPMPGEARLGAVIYTFDGRDVSATRADVPGLTTFWIDDVVHEVYPAPAATAAPG